MTTRTYLSIGDVLTLLREEFPDVTISKIRFLESQGLVNPERSPSGYRKFFEADVERLRWVLRQQREHFLPLKVIRDRLAGGDVDGAESVAPTAANGRVSQPAHVGAAAGERPRPAGVGRRMPARTAEQADQADNAAMARILADANRRTGRGPLAAAGASAPDAPAPGAPPDRLAPSADAPVGATTTTAPEPTTAEAGPSVPPAGPSVPPAGPSVPRAGPSVPPAGPSVPPAGPSVPPAGPDVTPGDPGVPAGVPPAEPPAPGAGPPGSSGASGASFTAAELCAASGLSETELAGLVGFGLIEPLEEAGMAIFDHDGLIVANLAAAFRKFGIEARHLRPYRNAVDRELGLIEQVIIPLLRQRNPESRRRAVEAAEELGALGERMRGALLGASLRRHVGG